MEIKDDEPILEESFSPKLFKLFNSIIKSNIQIYHDILECYPDEVYTNLIYWNIPKKWNT